MLFRSERRFEPERQPEPDGGSESARERGFRADGAQHDRGEHCGDKSYVIRADDRAPERQPRRKKHDARRRALRRARTEREPPRHCERGVPREIIEHGGDRSAEQRVVYRAEKSAQYRFDEYRAERKEYARRVAVELRRFKPDESAHRADNDDRAR